MQRAGAAAAASLYAPAEAIVRRDAEMKIFHVLATHASASPMRHAAPLRTPRHASAFSRHYLAPPDIFASRRLISPATMPPAITAAFILMPACCPPDARVCHADLLIFAIFVSDSCRAARDARLARLIHARDDDAALHELADFAAAAEARFHAVFTVATPPVRAISPRRRRFFISAALA